MYTRTQAHTHTCTHTQEHKHTLAHVHVHVHKNTIITIVKTMKINGGIHKKICYLKASAPYLSIMVEGSG